MPCRGARRRAIVARMARSLLAALLAVLALGALGVSPIADAAKSSKHKRHATRAAATRTTAETPLTGDSLTQATDAAKAAVPGGTVWRASTEDPDDASGAAYEVHVTKSDGGEVEVLLDKSFNVVKTQTSPQGPHH